MCNSIALSYGHLMDNVALIQLQMNRQDSRIKNKEGAQGVWIMHITLPYHYNVYQNNAVKIGFDWDIEQFPTCFLPTIDVKLH